MDVLFPQLPEIQEAPEDRSDLCESNVSGARDKQSGTKGLKEHDERQPFQQIPQTVVLDQCRDVVLCEIVGGCVRAATGSVCPLMVYCRIPHAHNPVTA
jgi:hypothetical protein